MRGITASAFATKSFSIAEECQFFSRLRLANGTFKSTAFNRLNDFNRIIADQWKKTGFNPHEVLDVGVSSGITSLEWVEMLAGEGFEVKLTAIDLVLQAHLIRLVPGFDALLDSSGYVLQYSVFGMPMTGSQADEARGLRRLVRVIGARLIAARGMTSPPQGSRPILLVHSAARNHPRISFIEDDLFAVPSSEMTGRFDAIRAANVLNLGYFQRAQIQQAIANLKLRLTGAGASFIVVRTHSDGSNHGSLFQLRDDGKFEVVERIGSGSEIEDLVASQA